MGAVTSWPQHVLWRKWACTRNQELPTGKQSKERWIQSVTVHCAWGSGVLCHHHCRASVAAQLGGEREREMTLAIPFPRCSVPSSPHNPTGCTSSAVPSTPGGFLEWLIKGPWECNLIRAWSDHRHSDVFSIFEWKKLQLCPGVKVKDGPSVPAEGVLTGFQKWKKAERQTSDNRGTAFHTHWAGKDTKDTHRGFNFFS